MCSIEMKQLCIPNVEVLYIDIFVWGRFSLAPEQETLFGCHLFNWNVLEDKNLNN